MYKYILTYIQCTYDYLLSKYINLRFNYTVDKYNTFDLKQI